ncbi:unnamed protein product [Microthlaspi erraticum]|uniref:t-SNARE coiled-coil homology domain-containing protein n=1 Tax=Microthlaspi erraticum TaxID=1685480 RepID=A0A6D2HUT6_9BRAS|nr:unnamed protein product [Microthlaspi erraticum]
MNDLLSRSLIRSVADDSSPPHSHSAIEMPKTMFFGGGNNLDLEEGQGEREAFLQKPAIEEQGGGSVLDRVNELQKRNDALILMKKKFRDVENTCYMYLVILIIVLMVLGYLGF